MSGWLAEHDVAEVPIDDGQTTWPGLENIASICRLLQRLGHNDMRLTNGLNAGCVVATNAPLTVEIELSHVKVWKSY